MHNLLEHRVSYPTYPCDIQVQLLLWNQLIMRQTKILARFHDDEPTLASRISVRSHFFFLGIVLVITLILFKEN